MLPEKDVHGDGIRLRSLEKDDLPRVVEWFNDPEFCKGLGKEPGLTLEEEEQWFEKIKEDPSVIVFAIENEEGEHIGNIALNRIDRSEGSAMISLAISRENWGNGYAKRAIRGIIDYASNTLELRELYATIYPFNNRSQQVFKKNGFDVDNRRSETHIFRGEEWPLVVMTLHIIP